MYKPLLIFAFLVFADHAAMPDTVRGGVRIEGLASAAPKGVLPASGLFAAGAITDFPPNTTIMVTNLVNGKTVQVVVLVPLDNPSFLILLSQEAADAIGLPPQYHGRVRVEKIIDPFSENRVSNGDPDYDPQALTAQQNAGQQAGDNTQTPPLDTDPKAETVPPIPPTEIADGSSVLPKDLEKLTPLPTDQEKEKNIGENTGLALVKAENRLPDRQPVTIPADAEVAPIKQAEKKPNEAPNADGAKQEPSLDESAFIEPLENALKETTPVYSSKGFIAPVLTTLEKGKYYLQLRAYNKPELVNSELERVEEFKKAEKDGKNSLSIYTAEVSGKPVYRIIIGPLNRAESEQLLRQYRSQGWTDAFVWLGQ
jgi:hypothetical protein